MSLLENLMQRAGLKKLPPKVKQRVGFKGFVPRSLEFFRVAGLPRRVWDEDAQHVAEVVELLTEELRTPAGEQTLHPVQAMALHDAAIYRGLFGPIGVGRGKTLISLLAPVVLEAERPVLFVPAALRDQTLEHVLPELQLHWRLHPELRIISYSALSLAKNADLLEQLRPDLIILDECDSAKHRSAGRTKRLLRFFAESPETMCVAMSGTVSSRSIKDWAHIAEWALGAGRVPVPTKWNDLADWADAVDELRDPDQRMAPGALKDFCQEGENVRQGFRRRLVETPGVVATKADELGVSLRLMKYTGAPGSQFMATRKVWAMIEELRKTWITPNGDYISEAVEVWRHTRELALGFWYRWEPEPPEEWMKARREWKKYVRETLKHNRRQLDTELQVWNECAKHAHPDFSYPGMPKIDLDPWRDWRDVKDDFELITVPEWVDDYALTACADWLDRCTPDRPGIVWTEHRAFAHKLSEFCARRYFGAGDSRILTCDDPGVIASVSAHGTGKNLQRFSQNLVVSPPTSGKVWEQLLGRTHRQGQQADAVTVEIFLHVPELLASFKQAQDDAQYLEDTYGNRQKLNYADTVL